MKTINKKLSAVWMTQGVLALLQRGSTMLIALRQLLYMEIGYTVTALLLLVDAYRRDHGGRQRAEPWWSQTRPHEAAEREHHTAVIGYSDRRKGLGFVFPRSTSGFFAFLHVRFAGQSLIYMASSST